MRKIWLFCIFLLLASTGYGQAPKYDIPDDPVIFGDTIRALLSHTRNERAIEIGDEFAATWQSLSGNAKEKVMAQTIYMVEKHYGMRPYLLQYFNAINNAINIEATDDAKFSQYLNVLDKTLKTNEKKDFVVFLNASSTFFEHNALYFQKSNKLYVAGGSYNFEYMEPPVVPELPEEEEVVEDEYVEDEDDWGDGGDDWDDDSWEEEEDTWEEESWEEETVSNEGIADVLSIEEAPPALQGPVISFENIDLNIVTPYDSVFVENTKGAFLLVENTFVGDGGKFDWTSAGLGADSVFCKLSTYNFNVKRPSLTAEKALLTHIVKLDKPVEGKFEFKSVRHDSTRKPVYPRFTSYYGGIKIKNVGKPNLTYIGGFTMKGASISSESLYGDLSIIEVMGDTGKKFIAKSKSFNLQDTLITSKDASVVTYQGLDSIYHPSLKFDFITNLEHLKIMKNGGGFAGTPYTTSHFNMFFKADMIKWDLNADSLDVSVVSGKKVVPAYFESTDHFSQKDFADLSGVYPFHPLRLVVSYTRKYGNEFHYSDLAKRHKLDEKTVRSAMVYLSQKGFVDFEGKSGMVKLKRKAVHYISSFKQRKDFDNIIIESLADSLPNATLYLADNTMKVRGVEKFDISKVLEVYIEPDSSEITLLKDRNFIFDGKIFAGNFEYIGRDYKFSYDSFLIKMGSIDSVRFYVKDKENEGSRRKKRVDNALVANSQPAEGDVQADINGTSGVLYINRPDNKSGKETYPNYPRFSADNGASVYFDKSGLAGGVYDKSISFDVPPFEIDSLSGSDPSAIGFGGTFKTSGILPDFEESIRVMDDYSMGFEHEVPPEGYQMYETDAKLFGDLKMDKAGLTSVGDVDFLTSKLTETELTLYPDSTVGKGKGFVMKEAEYGGVIFPDATVSDYSVNWRPRQDSMAITNNAEPFKFYNETASFDGTAILTSNGVNGSGTFSTRGSVAVSEQMTFGNDRFRARHAEFEVKTDDPDKPALAGKDVRFNFNLEENYADISPEVEGEAALEFPYAKFKTSITDARWDLNSETITMKKPDDVPLENSYFYTTRKELDSLRFNATEAVYDIKTQDIKISGVPYIIVADAKITPENGKIVIHENSRIGVLKNTTIILDTLNGYHRLYNGEVNIFSRNSFAGVATYEYVNSENDTFAIEMQHFRLEPISKMPKAGISLRKNRRKKSIGDREFQTVANGSVNKGDVILVSPRMYFKGDMTLYATKPALQLEGYVKLDLKKVPNYDTWIKYSSSAEQQEVVFDFNESVTEDGQKLEAGLLFGEDNSLYATFVSNKKGVDDVKFFHPEGYLYFKADKQEFVIEDSLKVTGKSYEGKVFTYNENTSDIEFEGEVSFMPKVKGVSLTGAAMGTGNLESDQFSLNAMLLLDFDIPNAAYEAMAEDISQVLEVLGGSEGLGDQTELLYKLGEVMGNKATKEYEELSQQEYVPLGGFAKEITKPLVFADVNLKWSPEQKSFYSEGQLGMSNILKNDVNGAFEGFLEIKKTEGGGTDINLFVKASPNSWFFFGYENNRLLLHSSNDVFNKIVADKSNAKKSKVGDMVFFPGDNGEVLNFIDRFRFVYFNIDDKYDLQSMEEDFSEPDSEGFGGASEDTETSDDDDDGF